MAELNGGQLAVLLRNWNHPVIRPFLATAAAGLAAITVYERGLPIDIDIKRLNHFIAHLAAPELGRGSYTPEKSLSPNYSATEIFILLEPELFSTAKVTARTSAPGLLGILDRIGTDGASAHLQTTSDLPIIAHHIGNDSTHAQFQAVSHLTTPAPVLPSHTSGAPRTATALPIDQQAQTASIIENGGILGLTAVGFLATGAIFVCKKYSNYKKAKAQRLTDEQLIAHLMLQLDEVKASKLIDGQRIVYLKLQLDDVTASKLKIETALKAAEDDLSLSNEDKNPLRGEFSVSTITNDALMRELDKAEEEREQNAQPVDETIKRLEKCTAVLEENRNTQVQTNKQLQDELSKAQLIVSVLRDEKDARELEVQEQLQEVRVKIDDLADQLAASESAADATQQQMSTRIDELDRQSTDHKLFSLEAEGELKEQVAAAEVLRQQAREANVALGIAQQRIAQLEKKKTASDLPKPGIPKAGAEDDNDDGLDHDTTGPTESSQQSSSQQQARPPGMSESPYNTITAEVDGEKSPMPMTFSVPPSGELSIPRRKKREFWHGHWRHMNSSQIYPDDVVSELELPCFDARFRCIGIVCPAENHEDRTLESGKVLEHTKCNLCLQWYTKKDMYDHLKTCKAFWELAIRCGYCQKIFKYNTAFFDKHVPDCKTQSTEEDPEEEHFTLAKSGADATTTQISQQVRPSSSLSIPPGKQINPDASPFTLGGSPPRPKKPIPTGPRYPGSKFQQDRGTSFISPQNARPPRYTPHLTPRGVSPAHGSDFGTSYSAARPPTGSQAYSAPRDNSQAYGSPGGQQ